MLSTESTTFQTPHPATRSAELPAPVSAEDATPVVLVVADDVDARAEIGKFIRSAGWRPQLFSSPHELLVHPGPLAPCCLVVDHAPPRRNGLELQLQVAHERPGLPIVFVTQCSEVRDAVQAMQRGAVEYLTKPILEDALVTAVADALERSRLALEQARRLAVLRRRYESLSRREREVMERVVDGRLNKQVGSELDISEITVKAHRGSAMRKMEARSLPALVMMAAHLGVGPRSVGVVA